MTGEPVMPPELQSMTSTPLSLMMRANAELCSGPQPALSSTESRRNSGFSRGHLARGGPMRPASTCSRSTPASSRRSRALQLGDCSGEGVEREGNVLVRVRERDVVLALALQDAARAQQRIAPLHGGIVAQGRTV